MPLLVCPRQFFAVALSVSLALLSSPAGAQEKPGKPDGPVISAWGAYLADADVGDGQVSSLAGRFRVSYKGFSFFYQNTEYSWDNLKGLPFGNGKDEPWESLQIASLGYGHGGKINQNWSWFGNLRVFSAFESEKEDSVGVGATAGVRYRINPDWLLVMGAAGRYGPMDSFALPLVGVSWNQGTPQGFSARIGFPLTSLSYRFNPQLALHFKMLEFSQYTYRLADDSVVEQSGYMEVDNKITGLQMEYSPLEQLKLVASVNYAFNRTLTSYDQDGNNEKEYDVDNTWGGGLRLVYSF